ncbi:MAG: valine--tRNA ligase [Clostridia bacterium]|nr:valine--tRNA ligase [Clostridia bacterium]
MNKGESMAKVYEPCAVEKQIYDNWESKGYFKGVIDPEKKPFTIVIPPPNITGQLHMGHALDETLQDIIIRFKRMQGYSALWLPGTDHASIATEAKIVDALAKEGLTKEQIGREEFLKRAWDWRKKYGSRIVTQLRSLGSSCDWTRERFTMDEGLSKAVREVFVRLYNKGLIYKGERITNWCPCCNTSISDIEIEYSEDDGNFWYINYPFADGTGALTIATTRPETLLGDVAVAVNPEDEKYKDIIGKMLILPLVNKEIPVIADDYVELGFGTGAVKITPAHDPNDYEVGKRHDLPVIRIMDDKGFINENGGQYAGMERYAARKQIVEDLKAAGLLVKIEPHKHNVGHCQRCGTVLEPFVSNQWYVKMKPLAGPAIDTVRSGRIRFVPDRFAKIYYNWMENIQDWCISRQLWWGHRIPAYYCADCGHITVARETPEKCECCGSTNITQDQDTLDTWFSSALWPFSTLGWPDQTEDLKYFYPTDVLVTGYDIIFFWVARMIFSACEQMGEVPFKTVLFHGLVRDSLGRKMSKSLGNGIDPLEIIDKFGTDALRFSLITGNSPGNDQRYLQEKVESARNFANKIWNATRFVLMNFDNEPDFSKIDRAKFTTEDKWILSASNRPVNEVTENLEKFELGVALSKVYDFVWDIYCDWYIEMVKPRLFDSLSPNRLEAQYVLNKVLIKCMKLLHPFMPFVTEAIFQKLYNDAPSIMISKWPETDGSFDFPKEEEAINYIIDAIKRIRNIRHEMGVPSAKKAHIIAVTSDENKEQILRSCEPILKNMAYCAGLTVKKDKEGIAKDAASVQLENAALYMPLEELIDIAKEIERLTAEKQNLENEINRISSKLSNENFVSKAPKAVVDGERAKLEKYRSIYENTVSRLRDMNER